MALFSMAPVSTFVGALTKSVFALLRRASSWFFVNANPCLAKWCASFYQACHRQIQYIRSGYQQSVLASLSLHNTVSFSGGNPPANKGSQRDSQNTMRFAHPYHQRYAQKEAHK